MSNVRDFAAHVTDGQKKKPSKAQIDKLLEAVKTELQSATPDYDGCVLALTVFPPQIVGIFYEDVYTHSPKDVCASFDFAFLTWAKSRPKIAGGNLAYIKMAQAIKKRLAIVSSADELLPELQWYISNFDDSRAARETKKIRDECELADLQKLLALDIQDWNINPEMLKKFYGILFADFTGSTTRKMYNAFLFRNHLIAELPPESEVSSSRAKDTPDGQNDALMVEAIPQCSASNAIPTDALQHGENVPHSERFACEATSLTSTTNISADTLQPCESPFLIPRQNSAESCLEKDGVKLAESLFAWVKKQTNGMAALRESLRSAERERKRLDIQFSNLKDELFLAKRELADREATIVSLQQELADTTSRLNLSQKQMAELDETIQRLQRMNENSASQAVSGYKAELASSLKSIVEDASLPEAQKDADILSALLGDLMDTLRFRGVPLEGN